MTSSDSSVGPSTPSPRHSRAPRAVFVAIAVALVAVVTTAVGSAARSDKWWWDNLGGPSSSQFSNLGQITKANVNRLEVAWFYPYAANLFNPDRRRGRDVHARAEQLAHRARRDDRQGDLDPRGARRHQRPRHQLLAERGRQGQAPAVLDQQLPPGDRRADRQVDHDVRQQRRSSTCAPGWRAPKARASACSRTTRARSGGTC